MGGGAHYGRWGHSLSSSLTAAASRPFIRDLYRLGASRLTGYNTQKKGNRYTKKTKKKRERLIQRKEKVSYQFIMQVFLFRELSYARFGMSKDIHATRIQQSATYATIFQVLCVRYFWKDEEIRRNAPLCDSDSHQNKSLVYNIRFFFSF